MDAAPLPPSSLSHRIIFVGMTNELDVTDTSHKNLQELSNYAARLFPGHWIFVGPGSENTWNHGRRPNGYWDQEASSVLHTQKESDHTVLPRTTILKQGTLAQKGKDSVRVNASIKSTSAFFRLIESETFFAFSSRSRSSWMTCNRNASCSIRKKAPAGAGPPRSVEKDTECGKEIPWSLRRQLCVPRRGRR